MKRTTRVLGARPAATSEAARHLGRLAAIGEVAVAITHEVNQPLTAILSNAQALRRMLAGRGLTGRDVDEALDDIEHEVRRAADIVERTRGMIRREPHVQELLNVNDIVRAASQPFQRAAATARVRIDLQLAADLPPVRGDRVQLQQVSFNLLSNAVNAVQRTTNDSSHHVRVRTLYQGRAVHLCVRDFGPGIERHVRQRLFEPFVTTRFDGLGLGLWITRMIVHRHEGRVIARNHASGGAEFCVILPRAVIPGSPVIHCAEAPSRRQHDSRARPRPGSGADRIPAEGYGPQHPVASNDTVEGRQRDRRIDLRVTRK